MGSDSLTTMMKIAVLASLVSLTCAQQAIQPASTQVLQFIDQNGDSIPVRPVGQQQQFQAAPQQLQQFAPQQQQQFAPQQQQQQFAAVPRQQQQSFAPQPPQQQFQAQPQHPIPTHLLQARPNEAAHHRNAAAQQQQLIALQRQAFSPHQLEAQQEFDSRPPPEFLPLDNMASFAQQPAGQQFNQLPAPVPQQRRPAPQPRPAAQQFSQFPATGAAPQARPAPQQRRPAPQQRRPAPQPVRAEPGSVNDDLGQIIVESEQYVHDPTGDNTLSRFQLFQQRKKQEAAASAAGQSA